MDYFVKQTLYLKKDIYLEGDLNKTFMDLKELVKQTLEARDKLDKGKLFKHLSDISSGAWRDVMDLDQCGNYLFLSALMQVLQPKQIIELGGAMGVGTLCMLATLSSDSKIYSITLEEHGLEFSFIKRDYPNLIKVIGDDRDLSVWLKDMELGTTDFWYIDSEHTEIQLRKELELYTPFFKKGTIIALDDIKINPGMEKVWNELKEKYESVDLTRECHFSGWGIIKI